MSGGLLDPFLLLDAQQYAPDGATRCVIAAHQVDFVDGVRQLPGQPVFGDAQVEQFIGFGQKITGEVSELGGIVVKKVTPVKIVG